MDRFYFTAINDIHYPGDAERPWMESVVARIQALEERPEFCLALGDLTDRGDEPSLRAMEELLAGAGGPLYPVIGNHDYAAGNDSTAWDTVFPGCRNYQFEHRGRRFLGLDTTQGCDYERTSIPFVTLEWLERILPDVDPRQPLVVFTHFPLGEGVRYRPLNAEALLRRLAGYRVQAVLSGHFHGDTERRFDGIALYTGRCCSLNTPNHDGAPEKGFHLLRADEDGLTRRFIPVS